MDTNHNANNENLIPKQPVMGAAIPENTELKSKSPLSDVSLTSHPSSRTIGSHNIASIHLATGRSLANTTPFSQTISNAPSSSRNIFTLQNRTSRGSRCGPATPAKIQFLILGSSGVGKTSLLRRLQNLNAVTEAGACSTIGPDLHRLKCGLVEAIDVGGSDECFPIAKAYADLSEVFLIMFDITSAESFLYARYWMNFLEQKGVKGSGSSSETSCERITKRSPTILLVGNKNDLVIGGINSKSRQVSRNMARNLAITFGAEYVEISARHDLSLSESIIDSLERKFKDNQKANVNDC